MALAASLYPAVSPLHVLEQLAPSQRVVAGGSTTLNPVSFQHPDASEFARLEVHDLARFVSMLDKTSVHLPPNFLMTVVTTQSLPDLLRSLTSLESTTAPGAVMGFGEGGGAAAGSGAAVGDIAARFTVFLEALAQSVMAAGDRAAEALREVLWAVMATLGISSAPPPAPPPGQTAAPTTPAPGMEPVGPVGSSSAVDPPAEAVINATSDLDMSATGTTATSDPPPSLSVTPEPTQIATYSPDDLMSEPGLPSAFPMPEAPNVSVTDTSSLEKDTEPDETAPGSGSPEQSEPGSGGSPADDSSESPASSNGTGTGGSGSDPGTGQSNDASGGAE